MSSKVDLPLSNLRAVVILIVVAFHSALPYLASQPRQPFAFDAEPYRWIAFPIIDRERWFGLDLFCAWQDISLMTLMFFLAGLFAPASLARKGARVYLSDRCWRIALPFLLAVAVLSPLAYYASYRLTALDPSPGAFWQHWLALPMWPSGPQWFLWQLFVLSALAAGLYGVAPRWCHALSRLAEQVSDRPLTFVAGLTGLSAVGYLPLALAYSPWDWTYLGPFSFQLSRPLHYIVYFFAAFATGSYGCERSVLRADGPVARHWLAWVAAAAICFCVWGGLTALTMPDWSASPLAYRLAAALAFPPACVTGVLAYLALASRVLRARHRVLDGLSSNAYGIYLVHYSFVLWLQYALIGAALGALSKASFVLSVALVLSWATSAGVKAMGKSFAKAIGKSGGKSGGKAIKALARRPPPIASEGPIADQTR